MAFRDPLPIETEALVKRLDHLFPPRCIKPGEDPSAAHRYAGKRDLIEWLQQQLELDAAAAARNQINVLR